MKPILFNTEMVRAILEGRKTVTRRVVKDMDIINGWDCEADGTPIAYIDQATGDSYPPTMPCPHHPGDILWVRETWAAWSPTYGVAPKLYYKADGDAPAGIKWRPSIHMPKEAARLFLRVTDVRVERLQDITDYRAEGIHPSEACEECFAVCGGCDPLNSPTGCDNEIDAFAGLWDRTVKPADLPLYGWDANPWVWVIEFERCDKPEGFV